MLNNMKNLNKYYTVLDNNMKNSNKHYTVLNNNMKNAHKYYTILNNNMKKPNNYTIMTRLSLDLFFFSQTSLGVDPWSSFASLSRRAYSSSRRPSLSHVASLSRVAYVRQSNILPSIIRHKKFIRAFSPKAYTLVVLNKANNNLVVWTKRPTALIETNVFAVVEGNKGLSSTTLLLAPLKNKYATKKIIIFSKETLLKHFSTKNVCYGLVVIFIITIVRCSGVSKFILVFFFGSSPEWANLALSSALSLPLKLGLKGVFDAIFDELKGNRDKMTMGERPVNKPPYKEIDPKKSLVSTMNNNQGIPTGDNPSRWSAGEFVFRRGSGIISRDGDVSAHINTMAPYRSSQGVHKLGWDYLLNILGNSLSSGKVTEVVEICFTTTNSNDHKLLMGMRFDLRTLPLNHSLHPENKSPIFSLINKTNARTITKHIIPIQGTTEEFVAHLWSEESKIAGRRPKEDLGLNLDKYPNVLGSNPEKMKIGNLLGKQDNNAGNNTSTNNQNTPAQSSNSQSTPAQGSNSQNTPAQSTNNRDTPAQSSNTQVRQQQSQGLQSSRNSNVSGNSNINTSILGKRKRSYSTSSRLYISAQA